MYRKVPLVEEELYHIFTKSIAGFRIFNSNKDFERILQTIAFYTLEEPPCKFSVFLRFRDKRSKNDIPWSNSSRRMIKIIAYCIMPTHIHLILQQFQDGAISRYMNLVLKSYSKYFNIKYKRKGPLWEGRFRNIAVDTDEQLIHLTRYIHLNPTTASLVVSPEDWQYSSYREYVGLVDEDKKLCDFSNYLDMSSVSYKKFVNSQISYQKELSRIKHLVLE